MSDDKRTEDDKANAELAALEAELAEARARRAEAAAARDKAKAPERLRRQIAVEEKAAANDELFAELQNKHGESDVRRIDSEDGDMIVVGRPAPVAFKRFQQSKTSVDDCDALVRTCLLTSKDGYNATVSKFPALIVSAANAASEIAGVRRKEAEGK